MVHDIRSEIVATKAHDERSVTSKMTLHHKKEPNKVEPTSIKIHSDQADYYRYRTPYIAGLFEAVCKELGITKTSTLMDLGCGRGEVASYLSNYAKKVYAIDGSKEMIDLSIKKEGIEYQVVDLNAENPVIKNKVDHLFFGRSIHWFPSESLHRLSSKLLDEEGCIVVCSTQWSPVGDWGRVYFETRHKFIPPRQKQRHDFTGFVSLNGAGFVPTRKLAVDQVFRVDVDFMTGHTFSTTYRENLKKLKSLSTEFGDEMKRSLQRYEEKNEMAIKVTSWAQIYKRSS